ncbi:acid-sensing ion channel 3-like [Tubulanus polymorphus]|uniref:acid-sensing ion channel 3-like n=1 Tax=Tubulanus polymorphus TaxID=672921 RepID=UPI003DA6CA5E
MAYVGTFRSRTNARRHNGYKPEDALSTNEHSPSIHRRQIATVSPLVSRRKQRRNVTETGRKSKRSQIEYEEDESDGAGQKRPRTKRLFRMRSSRQSEKRPKKKTSEKIPSLSNTADKLLGKYRSYLTQTYGTYESSELAMASPKYTLTPRKQPKRVNEEKLSENINTASRKRDPNPRAAPCINTSFSHNSVHRSVHFLPADDTAKSTSWRNHHFEDLESPDDDEPPELGPRRFHDDDDSDKEKLFDYVKFKRFLRPKVKNIPTDSFREYFEGCSSITSIHGASVLYKSSTTTIRRTLWIGLLTVCLALAIFLAIVLVSRLQRRETHARISFNQQQSILFPAVRICLPSTSDDQAKTNNRTAKTVDAYLTHCRWKNVVKECSGLFWTGFDNKRICFTFNDSSEVSVAGSSRGLDVEIVPEILTATVYIYAQDDVAKNEDFSEYLLASSQTAIRVQSRQIEELPMPFSNCTSSSKGPYSNGLRHYGKYTRSRCIVECETEMVHRGCGCRLHHHPGNSAPCITQSEQKCASRILESLEYGVFCHCPFECTRIEYLIRTSRQPNHDPKSHRSLRIFLPDLMIEQITMLPVYDEYDLFCDLAAILVFLAGISAVSVIHLLEVIVVAVAYISSKVRSTRSRLVPFTNSENAPQNIRENGRYEHRSSNPV